MAIVFKIIGYLSIPLMIFSAYTMIKSLNRDQRIKTLSLVLPMVTSVAAVFLYTAILKITTSTFLSAILAIVGFLLGIWWSRSTILSIKNGAVTGKRSSVYIVVWILTIAITQLMSQVSSPKLVALGISSMFFSTGLALGTNLSLLSRRHKLASTLKSASRTCPHCGKTVAAGLNFCTYCGNSLASAGNAVRSQSCSKCQSPLKPDLKFCTYCGQKLVHKSSV